MEQSTMINEFKPNETYSSLKEPNPTLSKEQSAMKVTKEKKAQKIKGIEEVIESEELDTDYYGFVSSLTMTEDKRIASGGADGNISISSYDINERTWKREIHKEKAHDGTVASLCTLNGNRLLSGGNDCSIKVWSLSNVVLTVIKEIKGHTGPVRKVIPLSRERFASCSRDKTVRIWKDDNTYECISTLQHDNDVRSILQLRGKEVLVSSCRGFTLSSSGVSFWNINDYTHQQTIKGYCVNRSTYMIELSNGNIALSLEDYPYFPIVIIDSSSYQIVTMFLLKGCISDPSILVVFDEHSFIYAHEGTFVQISNEDGTTLFHSKRENFDGHYGGILLLEGGKYIAIEGGKRIYIIKPCFSEC